MSRPRKKTNRQLPKGWRNRYGAFYYRVPMIARHLWGGKSEVKLGNTFEEAWSKYMSVMTPDSGPREDITLEELLRLYEVKVLPQKAPRTIDTEKLIIPKLVELFPNILLYDFEPFHIWRVTDTIAEQSPSQANRYLTVVSNAYQFAHKKGFIKVNLFRRLPRYPVAPADRYIEDWEVDAAMEVANKLMKAYIGVKMTTGLRKGDILRLKLSDIHDDGLYADVKKTSKTKFKRLCIAWCDELLAAVNIAAEISEKRGGKYLFTNINGEPYWKEGKDTTSGHDSAWDRMMDKAIAKGKLKESFKEKDLRAKVGSDTSLPHAVQLLAHGSSITTATWYRRRREVVEPFSRR